jgi:hypothetical protein
MDLTRLGYLIVESDTSPVALRIVMRKGEGDAGEGMWGMESQALDVVVSKPESFKVEEPLRARLEKRTYRGNPGTGLLEGKAP